MKKSLAVCAGQYDQEGGWARHPVQFVWATLVWSDQRGTHTFSSLEIYFPASPTTILEWKLPSCFPLPCGYHLVVQG